MAESSSWTEQLKRLVQLQPAVVRGFLVAITGVLALVLGHSVIDNNGVETILDAYTALSALISAFWIRPAVTPHVKVVAYKPNPFTTNEVTTGPADDLVQAISNLDTDGVNVEVPPVFDPSLIQQEDVKPVQTDNSAREEDGDQSDVSQKPVFDAGDGE